jgi:hypothetical protein
LRYQADGVQCRSSPHAANAIAVTMFAANIRTFLIFCFLLTMLKLLLQGNHNPDCAVDYYNNVRTHQTLNGETPVKSKPPPKTAIKDTVLISKPILGGLYHSYEKQCNYKASA